MKAFHTDIETEAGFRLRLTGSHKPGDLHVDWEIHPYTGSELDDEPSLTGSVKWDGCSNWDTGNTMLHACDREQLAFYGEAMAVCWSLTKQQLGVKFIA